ncbi:hypothetical protein MKK84_06950 [Methylobacterium sp. E-065]|uniref:hypothetical protein n=1 Tax=Methylobacterium sp. E-065 TaxID=2836583 RepID=UPI001FBB05BC|nr:hypothetical protein [Methylobacterium sp. E-065]MCJ2017161.1 hypothetical protein [Methylobacterium sp. E-065]
MTTLVYEELRAAVEAAAPDRLATVASAMAQAYGAGGLTDEQYEQLDGLLAARRRVAQAAPVRMQTLATACAQLVPAAAPAPEGQGTAPARTHHRTGSRPRSAESAARRRRWAAAGYLPPRLAAAFTSGEQAVLAVVAMEVGKRGTCTLALGHIAALAGVCATVAKRALRQARTVGLVTVEERRLTGFRNDTNVVRVASSEWAGWLRLRMPRASHAGLQGIGGTVVRPTDIQILRGRSTSRSQAENRHPAAENRTTRPTARVAGA